MPGFLSGNVGTFRHPCDGNPLCPNLRLLLTPTLGVPFEVPFDVAPINPNNLGEYRIEPLGLLLAGELMLTVLPLSANDPVVDGSVVRSAVTSLYGVTLEQSLGNSATFGIQP